MNNLKELYLKKKEEVKQLNKNLKGFNKEISTILQNMTEDNIKIQSHLTGTNKFTLTFINQEDHSRIQAVIALQIKKKCITNTFNTQEQESISSDAFANQLAFCNKILPFINSISAEDLIAIIHLKNKRNKELNKTRKEFTELELKYFKEEAAGDLSHLFNVFSFLDKENVAKDKKDFYGEKSYSKKFVSLIINEDNVTFEEIELSYTNETKRQFTGKYGHVISKAKAFDLLEKQISLNDKLMINIDDIPHIVKSYKNSNYGTMKISAYVEKIRYLSVSNKLSDF